MPVRIEIAGQLENQRERPGCKLTRNCPVVERPFVGYGGPGFACVYFDN